MELFTTRGQVDLKDGFNWSVNYTTADLVDLTKRKTNYTKTVKVPYTANNARIFQGLDQPNADNIGYDTRKFLGCYLQHNGQTLLEGVLIVLSWSRTKEAQEIEIQLLQRTKSLMADLKGVNLNELDFSYLEHDYTIDNIVASYDGFNVVNGTLQPRDGYIYPLVDYGKDDTIPERWQLEDMRPSIFLRELIDRLFLLGGLTYSSDFFTGPYWNSLVLLNTQKDIKLTDAQKLPYGTEAQNSTQQNTFTDLFTWPNYEIEIPTLIELDTVVTDPLSQWDITTPTAPFLTVGQTGQYQFRFTASLTLEHALNLPWILVYDILSPIPRYVAPTNVTQYIQLKINGVVYDSFPFSYIPTVTLFDQPPAPSTVQWYPEPSPLLIDYLITLDLQAGDVLEWQILQDEYLDSGLDPALVVRFKLDDSQVVGELLDAELSPGQQLNFINYVPNIKASDFINTVFNTFNLWVIDDPYNPDNLIIEPRTNFFDLGGYVDWSEKQDVSRLKKYDFLAEQLPKRFLYRFTNSDDRDVKQYQEANDFGYADFDSEVETDLTQQEQEIKTLLTPLIATQEPNGLIYPHIYTQDNVTDPKGDVGAVLKIGFVRKLQGFYQIEDSTGVTGLNEYIAVTEFDNPLDPVFTLTFGQPQTTLNQAKPAYWNLYRLFHQLTEEEKTRKGAKVVTLYVYLDENDIRQLDIRRVVFIDQVYYRIVKIENFNPLTNAPTKVQLLQIEAVKYDFTSNEIIYKIYTDNNRPVLATNRQELITTNANQNVQTN